MANYFDKFDDLPTGVQGNYFDQFDEPVAKAGPEEDTSTFMGRAQEQGAAAGSNIVDSIFGADEGYDMSNVPEDIQKAFGDADYSPNQKASDITSELITTTSNILVDGGLSLVRAVLPDDWEEAVVDFSRETWEHISENSVMKEGIALAKQGIEAYSGWAKDNPEYAKRLEQSINIGALGRTGASPRGKTYERKVRATEGTNRRQSTLNALEPIDKKDRVKRLYDPGKGRSIRYEPSPFEKAMADEAVRVKDFKPGKSHVHNMNALRRQSQSFKEELDTLVGTRGGDINVQGVKTGLANKVNNLSDEVLLAGDAEVIARKIYSKVDKLLDESDGTSLGLLNVRRQLDEWVNSQRAVYDSSFENGTKVALREIRGYLNDQVAKSTGSTRVKTLLDKQHKLLGAGDVFEAKAVRQADGVIGQAIQKLEEITGDRLPTTPLAQYATAGAAATALGTTVGAGAAGTGLSLFAGYKGARWLMSPDGRVWLAKLVQLTDKYPQINPEVNALVQMSQGLNPDEQE